MGIFAVNKPKGYTSHDVVAIIRRATGIRRVGHAGTLDPLAEGVLVVAVGREFTKTISHLMKGQKEYVAEITLGRQSSTDDEEGEKTIVNIKEQKEKIKKLSIKEIKEVLRQFVGDIQQVPPHYSAVKIKGRAAYTYARAGTEIKLEPKTVHIESIEVIDYAYPILKLKIICGSGVYIRSLARDIGKVLQVGAYMSALVRTRVGEYTIDNSIPIEQIKNTPHILDKVI